MDDARSCVYEDDLIVVCGWEVLDVHIQRAMRDGDCWRGTLDLGKGTERESRKAASFGRRFSKVGIQRKHLDLEGCTVSLSAKRSATRW